MVANASSNRKLRLGLVGSLPPPLGGVTVLFKCLIDALELDNSVHIEVVDIPFGIHSISSRVSRTVQVCWNCMRMIRNVDVLSLHVPTAVLPILGPAFCIMAKLYNKRLIIRKFGGTDYTKYGLVRRALSKCAVNCCDVYLAEARQLVSIAQGHGTRTAHWYPNNRPCSPDLESNDGMRTECRKFVYVGQIYKEKGVFDIGEATQGLSLEFPVDFYGPFYFGTTVEDLRRFPSIRYMGVLEPYQVISTLRNYDALIIPTYWSGEGYPGVIIEAFFAGIPVICTKWRFLPEMVDESSGLLIEPKNIEALKVAMNKLLEDHKLYSELCSGAKRRGELFRTDHWAQRFIEICRSLSQVEKHI